MRRTLLRLVQVVLSIGILLWIYSKVPIENVLATLRAADVRWVFLSAGFVLLLQALVAIRWGKLVEEHGSRLSLWTLASIQFASVFYKLFIPGGMLASIGVRYFKLQKLGGTRAAAFSSVVVDRLLATFGLGVVGVAAWLLDDPAAPSPVGWGIAAWSLATSVLLLAVVHPRTSSLARSLAASGRWRAVTGRLVKLSDAFGMYRGVAPRRIGELAIFTIIPHGAGFLAYWALARAVGVDVEVLTWAWLRAAVTLVTTQPISIAGVGVRDAVIVWLLAFYGVGQEQALAVAFLMLGVTVLMPAAVGGLLEARMLFEGGSGDRP